MTLGDWDSPKRMYTKNQFASDLARKTNITKRDSHAVIAIVLELMAKNILEGKVIRIPGLGRLGIMEINHVVRKTFKHPEKMGSIVKYYRIVFKRTQRSFKEMKKRYRYDKRSDLPDSKDMR